MDYTTVSALTAYLGISSSDDNALLADCITRASRMLDEAAGQTFGATSDATYTFDAVMDVHDGRLLTFDGRYACAITSVTNGDGVSVAASEYTTEPRNTPPYYGLTLKRNSSQVWTFSDAPEDAISITARWACTPNADGTPSAAIVQAAVRLAAWLYRQKDTHADADRVIQTGDGMTVLPMQLPKDVQDIIAPWRRLTT